MDFNKEQKELINHKEGACVVFAGAGAGKSASATNRVKQLILSGVDPSQILITTFSNKSAQDLKNKLSELFVNNVTVGTFHSVCGKMLYSKGIDTTNKIKQYEIDNLFKGIDRTMKTKEVQAIMRVIGLQKNNLIGVDDTYEMRDFELTEEYVREFYRAYENYKKAKRVYDWDDVLLLAYEELKKNNVGYTYEYIIVDESNDNNVVQMELVKLLCPSGNIMLVGDEKQAIYGFRGSKPELMLNFKNEFPDAKIINLYMNYRSTNNIVETANGFIQQYCDKRYYVPSKAFNQNNGEIKIIEHFDKENEAKKIADMIEAKLKKGVAPNDICILYRNNQNSFEIEKELKERNIEYFINSEDGSFFNRNEIKGIMAVLRLIHNTKDNEACNEIFNKRFYPLKFISNNIKDSINNLSAKRDISMFDACDLIQTQKDYQKKSLKEFRNIIESLIIQYNNGTPLMTIINNIIRVFKIKDYIEDKYDEQGIEERLESLNSLKSFVKNNTLDSFLNFVYCSNKSKKTCGINDIQLMTCHKSKGLEFKEVFLIGVEDGKFPSARAFDIVEEARLFYVATTRSKENLTISQIGDYNKFVSEYRSFLEG